MSNATLTETNRQFVTGFYQCLSSGDFAGAMDCLHDDVEVHEPECLPYGGVWRGKDKVRELFTKAPQYLDIGVFNIEAIVADGDRVIGMIHSAVAGSGTPTLIAEESQIRDGKIFKVRVFHFNPTLIKAS